ncbi:MAG TPA: CBS domain-containing protein [Candidatus Aenigmarchaeota archaeon]|nr:CBS domain-containing protein [Candidatus Aenigmarchaeota archaeon]
MKELEIITKRLRDLDDKISKKNKNRKYIKFRENVLETIKVNEILETPEVVEANTPVEKIIELMSEKNILEILVSKDEKIVGIVTLSKLLDLLRLKKNILELRAHDIVDKIIKINKKDNLSKAILIMNIHKSPCVVIFDKSKLLGIVTKAGILNKLSKIIFTKHKDEKIDEIIETKVDQLIDILKEGETNMDVLKKKLNIDEEKIEEWIDILEKQGVIEIKKSHFGKLKVKVKDVR